MKIIDHFFHILIEFFEIVFIGAAVSLIVFIFIAQLSKVDGDSMLPTLETDERVVVEKLTYKFRDIRRGDIVVAQNPQNGKILVIKRVIAVSGDKIKLAEGKIYINGIELTEPYLSPGTFTNSKTYLLEGEENFVPIDQYVLLGDNRSKSNDSRDWGFLKKEKIVGKGFIIYWPLNKFRLI